MSNPEGTGYLFVYGTLRPGHYNYRMLETALRMEPFENVEAMGKLYHASHSSAEMPTYPVADFQEQGTVVGSLLLVRWDLCDQVRDMEIGAGYHEVEITVRPKGWRTAVRAVAYHWPHVYRGELAEGGDWNKVVDGARKFPARRAGW